MTVDIDKGYVCAEHPASFNARWQQVKEIDGVAVRNGLSPEEQQACSGCKTAEEAFRVLYPDYKSLDQWREEQLAKPADKGSVSE